MITHITPREQALEAENARYLTTIRVQAEAIEVLTSMKQAPYFQHYQDALGKLAVAKASAEMWKRKAEQVEADSLKMAQETDEIVAGLTADAARYQWLRKKERAQLFSGLFIGVERSMNKRALYGAEADAAIDAAMKESE